MAYHPEPQLREENGDRFLEDQTQLLTSRLTAAGRRSPSPARFRPEPPVWGQWTEIEPQLPAQCSSLGYFLSHPDQRLIHHMTEESQMTEASKSACH